jgi:hypothetical protein
MAVLYDMEFYREFGGGAVVENTSHGLQRNLQFMKEVSQRTGIHVIAGTGNSLIEVFIFFKYTIRNFAYIIVDGYIYCRYKSAVGKLQIPHCMKLQIMLSCRDILQIYMLESILEKSYISYCN